MGAFILFIAFLIFMAVEHTVSFWVFIAPLLVFGVIKVAAWIFR